MHFSEKIHAAMLSNDIQILYMINEDFELGTIFALYKESLYEYIHPNDLEEAESFYINMAEVIAHYVEIEKWDTIDNIIKATITESDDETLMLVCESIIKVHNDSEIDIYE